MVLGLLCHFPLSFVILPNAGRGELEGGLLGYPPQKIGASRWHGVVSLGMEKNLINVTVSFSHLT